MTRTVRTSLGFSPLTGARAITQARRFKDQMRSIYEKPDSVSLLSVPHPDPPRYEIVAHYDMDDPVASSWVKHAVERAPELWEKLAARRTGHVR